MIDHPLHTVPNTHLSEKDPSVMMRLFTQMPLHAEFFVIKALDMKGVKVNLPSRTIRSHIHCFFFITEGEALITIGEESYFFKANECAVIPAGQIFSISYFDNCAGYMGGFSNELMSGGFEGRNLLSNFGILRRRGMHKVLFDEKYAEYVENLFARLLEEYDNGKNNKIVKAYLTSLLTELEENSKQSEENPLPIDNELCNRFIELAFKECNHGIPLSEYARKLNITKGYLNKIVGRFTGKTPLVWIVEAVIMEAKVLLSQTEMTIGEIAARLGFDDPSYFSRLFRKQTELAPVEYRKRSKVRI